jgi:anti-anti-sigma regulatory factor
MSCRIDRSVTDENIVVFFVSGRITGEHVGMLREVLEHDTDAVVDLRNVNLVDREAVKLLALCEAKGRELRNCPRYIREWITTETDEAKRAST